MTDSRTLNITNGDTLTERLVEQKFEGDILTWSEMLCEGPTTEFIGTSTYFELRKKFFNDYYDLILDEEKFHIDLQKLDNTENYDQIVLWFEYDLFCHINMLAVLSLIKQKNIDVPVYLVCSGYTEGHTLVGLSELSDKSLKKHFDSKIKLTFDDLELGYTLWRIYCGKDHNLLKPYITSKSSFQYLSPCLKAHLKRFPDSKTGLDVLETNILTLIDKNSINSEHHLLGYILNYQGYYGYGDMQLKRMISKLSHFFSIVDDKLKLNEMGYKALSSKFNFSIMINDNIMFGGINKLDYQFSVKENKLIKPKFNATTSF
ncbi:hypothetical protein SAMN03097699_0872 [Flavobacteriaceae bacterium MAR_2010_188]|nr:hypothetical protein SAMN03097699_0872 [Flavobacteriaceae bacterium MAR_2010_188]